MSTNTQRRRPSIAELKAAGSGRWREILADAGIPIELLDGRGHPCPRCGGTDRFAAWRDVSERGAVHCRGCFTSGSSPKPGDGIATLRWTLQCDTKTACRWLDEWLWPPGHHFRQQRPKVAATMERPSIVAPVVNGALRAMAERCTGNVPEWLLANVARSLGLPMDVLRRLRVGWLEQDRATTWPMVDSAGDVVGVRLRSSSGERKWAVKGGKAGMFVPSGMSVKPTRLFIAEGPTDTAAILSLGLDAIGRSSATGPVEIEREVIRGLMPAECIIVADNDKPGMQGASRLAKALSNDGSLVRVLTPPERFGDVRDWVVDGASYATLNIAAGFTKPFNLNQGQ